jgi:hypothetical protein
MLSVLRARSNTVEALSPLFTPRVWASQYGAGPKCKDSFDHSSLDSPVCVRIVINTAWTLTRTADRLQVDNGTE